MDRRDRVLFSCFGADFLFLINFFMDANLETLMPVWKLTLDPSIGFSVITLWGELMS